MVVLVLLVGMVATVLVVAAVPLRGRSSHATFGIPVKEGPIGPSSPSGSPGCRSKYACASSCVAKFEQLMPVLWEWFAHAGTALPSSRAATGNSNVRLIWFRPPLV